MAVAASDHPPIVISSFVESTAASSVAAPCLAVYKTSSRDRPASVRALVKAFWMVTIWPHEDTPGKTHPALGDPRAQRRLARMLVDGSRSGTNRLAFLLLPNGFR